MTPVAIVYVEHTPGGRLSNGEFSGLGGKTTYHVAITTNGIDRRPVGPAFDSPQAACRYADEAEARAQA